MDNNMRIAATLPAIACLAFLAVLSACQPSPPDAATADTNAADAVTDQIAPVPAVEPEESALNIKRGMVTPARQGYTFRACDNDMELRVIDQTDNTLQQVIGGWPSGPGAAIYIEARGERTSGPPTVTSGSTGVFYLEELTYASPNAESGGCKPAPAYRLIARGNEPFWAVELYEERLLYRRPEVPNEIEFSSLAAVDAEGGSTYLARNEALELELAISMEDCQDSMSGEFFAYSAQARIGPQTLEGCARVAE